MTLFEYEEDSSTNKKVSSICLLRSLLTYVIYLHFIEKMKRVNAHL